MVPIEDVREISRIADALCAHPRRSARRQEHAAQLKVLSCQEAVAVGRGERGRQRSHWAIGAAACAAVSVLPVAHRSTHVMPRLSAQAGETDTWVIERHDR